MPDSPVPLEVNCVPLTVLDRLALLETIEVTLDVSGRRGPQSVSSRPEHLRRLRDLFRASLSE